MTYKLQQLIEITNESCGREYPKYLDPCAKNGCELVCCEWARESPGKLKALRYCYSGIGSPHHDTVLDIGGGLSHLTPRWLNAGSYTLLDPLHHFGPPEQRYLESLGGGAGWLRREDWASSSLDGHSIVIANDLFPNVDFRIEQFAEHILVTKPREVRLALTLFFHRRSMQVIRVGSNEPLTVVPLSGTETSRAMKKICPSGDFSALIQRPSMPSTWINGRYVFFLRLVRE